MKKALILTAVLTTAGAAAEAGTFTVSPTVEKFTYKEYNDGRKTNIGNVLDKEEGTLKGVELSYEKKGTLFKIPNYLKVRLSLMGGSTDYDGHLQDGTPYSSTTDNKLLYLQVSYGPGLSFGESLQVEVSPTFDYGVRYWDRELEDYTEKYIWFYLGGSLNAKVKKGRFHALLQGYYQKALNPKIKVETDGGDAVLDLGGTKTYGLSVRAGYDLTEHLTLWGGFEYRYTHIEKGRDYTVEDGRTVYTFYEPESKTWEKLFSAGVSIRW
jgi:hypothetical protein